MAWHGMPWCDMVWHGVTWCVMVWHGVSRSRSARLESRFLEFLTKDDFDERV